MIEFTKWPKIARLFRDIVITEKIDGENSAIGVVASDEIHEYASTYVTTLVGDYHVYAQSRSRIIAPGKTDNHGFARWVWDYAEVLAATLGPGVHFGEWWGSGINRGYGLPKGEKRFSLFNTKRWHECEFGEGCQGLCSVNGLYVVPIIYQGEFSTLAVKMALESLRLGGSFAAPQYRNPEGVVVYHTAGNVMFKATLEHDEKPKSWC